MFLKKLHFFSGFFGKNSVILKFFLNFNGFHLSVKLRRNYICDMINSRKKYFGAV